MANILRWSYKNRPNRKNNQRSRVVIVSPEGDVLLYAFSLIKLCSSNIAEYKALIIELQIGEELGVKYLEVYRYSRLVINQVRGEYEVRNKDLISYYRAIIAWTEKFKGLYINHIPRKDNMHVDALTSLVATLALPPKVEQKVLVARRNLYHPKYALEINMAI